VKYILAIDDDPERYTDLRRILGAREAAGREVPAFRIATCPACVVELLPGAGAVLLDYDLDWTRDDHGRLHRCPCPRCLNHIVSGEYEGMPPDGLAVPRFTGEECINAVERSGLPVIVVSDNPWGGQRLLAVLRACHVRVELIRASSSCATERWVSALYGWGTL
jgi:hypothetical protein